MIQAENHRLRAAESRLVGADWFLARTALRTRNWYWRHAHVPQAVRPDRRPLVQSSDRSRCRGDLVIGQKRPCGKLSATLPRNAETVDLFGRRPRPKFSSSPRCNRLGPGPSRRLPITLHNAGLIASVTLLPRLADHAATRGCPDHAHEWATITSPWISSGLTIRPEQARQFPRRRLGPFHADSNSWPAIPISRV